MKPDITPERAAELKQRKSLRVEPLAHGARIVTDHPLTTQTYDNEFWDYTSVISAEVALIVWFQCDDLEPKHWIRATCPWRRRCEVCATVHHGESPCPTCYPEKDTP